MKRMLIHAIEAEAFMRELGVSSKLNADWSFLTRLRHTGRAAAERWLAANSTGWGRNRRRRSRSYTFSRVVSLLPRRRDCSLPAVPTEDT